ncbi:hypothetical protein PSPO01_00508 [Paraphaeosphaeria sporulosa]
MSSLSSSLESIVLFKPSALSLTQSCNNPSESTSLHINTSIVDSLTIDKILIVRNITRIFSLRSISVSVSQAILICLPSFHITVSSLRSLGFATVQGPVHPATDSGTMALRRAKRVPLLHAEANILGSLNLRSNYLMPWYRGLYDDLDPAPVMWVPYLYAVSSTATSSTFHFFTPNSKTLLDNQHGSGNSMVVHILLNRRTKPVPRQPMHPVPS